jgi:hypothetical protein
MKDPKLGHGSFEIFESMMVGKNPGTMPLSDMDHMMEEAVRMAEGEANRAEKEAGEEAGHSAGTGEGEGEQGEEEGGEGEEIFITDTHRMIEAAFAVLNKKVEFLHPNISDDQIFFKVDGYYGDLYWETKKEREYRDILDEEGILVYKIVYTAYLYYNHPDEMPEDDERLLFNKQAMAVQDAVAYMVGFFAEEFIMEAIYNIGQTK